MRKVKKLVLPEIEFDISLPLNFLVKALNLRTLTTGSKVCCSSSSVNRDHVREVILVYRLDSGTSKEPLTALESSSARRILYPALYRRRMHSMWLVSDAATSGFSLLSKSFVLSSHSWSNWRTLDKVLASFALAHARRRSWSEKLLFSRNKFRINYLKKTLPCFPIFVWETRVGESVCKNVVERSLVERYQDFHHLL